MCCVCVRGYAHACTRVYVCSYVSTHCQGCAFVQARMCGGLMSISMTLTYSIALHWIFWSTFPPWNQALANRLVWLASEPLDSIQLSLPLLQQRNYQRMPPCLAFRWGWRSELRSSHLQNKGIASEPSLQPCFQFSFFKLKTIGQASFTELQ